MNKKTLWYERYSGSQINEENFYHYFEKNGSSETSFVHYYETDEGFVISLWAEIEGDYLVELSLRKTIDVSPAHGKPVSKEKPLNSHEKELIQHILEMSLITYAENEIDLIMKKAASENVSYGGYTIIDTIKDGVSYTTPEGKRGKLSRKQILWVLDYSHNDLKIIHDTKLLTEFMSCLGKIPYEPMKALLMVVEYEKYPNFNRLNAIINYDKLKKSIIEKNLDDCITYKAGLGCSEKKLIPLMISASNSDEILNWLVSEVNSNFEMSGVLCIAVAQGNSKLIGYLLEKGNLSPETVAPRSWKSPVHIAHINRKWEYMFQLAEAGYLLDSTSCKEYFNTLSIDELEAHLNFKVEFDVETLRRIIKSGRDDLLNRIKRKEKCRNGKEYLLEFFVDEKQFEEFKDTLNYVDSIHSSILLRKAFNNGRTWADSLMEKGFDINSDNGQLLWEACENKEIELVKYMLENKAKPYLKDDKGEHSIFVAAVLPNRNEKNKEGLQKREELCKYLLDYGMSPTKVKTKYVNPISTMLEFSEEFLTFFIDWLAEHKELNLPVVSFGNVARLPVSYSLDTWCYNPKVLRYFIEKGAVVNAEGITEDKLFYKACGICEVDELKLLVKHGANIHETDKHYKVNGLFFAAMNGSSLEKIKYLVELGLDLNSYAHDEFKYRIPKSVLDIAEEYCNSEIVEFLKTKGAKSAKDFS